MRYSDEGIARICHEANRALCLAFGDTSQKPWDDAPDWQRGSALDGVRKIKAGEVTRPEQSHESWMAHKVAEGWVYGPTKNPETKEHPSLRPFPELDAPEQAKDFLFFAIVKAALTGN